MPPLELTVIVLGVFALLALVGAVAAVTEVLQLRFELEQQEDRLSRIERRVDR